MAQVAQVDADRGKNDMKQLTERVLPLIIYDTYGINLRLTIALRSLFPLWLIRLYFRASSINKRHTIYNIRYTSFVSRRIFWNLLDEKLFR